MEALKKARGTVRAAVTKRITAVEAELAEEEPNSNKLVVHFQGLEAADQKLNDLDEKIETEMLVADCTQEELDAESDLVEEYMDKLRMAKLEINQIVQPRPPSPAASVSSFASASAGGEKKTFKLPKIELKKFSGELTEWLSWWSQFQKIDEDTDLHNSDKFQYLLQCMIPGSKAHTLVERYPQTTDNYPKVIEALKERFGKDKLLRQVYIRELIKMIINQNRDKSGKPQLSVLYDQLYSHLSSLDSLGKVTDPREFLFPMVESALPPEVLVAWQRSPLHGKDGSTEDPPKSELDFLMEFLQKEIDSEQERALAESGFGLNSNEKKKDFHQNPRKYQEKVPTAAGLFSGESKLLCLFCDRKHESDKCISAQSMTLEEKRQKLNSKKACHNCFKTGHWIKNCKAFVKCHICGRRHHVLMCPNKETKSQPLNPQAQEFVSTTTTNLDCTNEIILQTIMVKLINEETGREKAVRALIDTGSQRSYILRATTNKLRFKSRQQVTLHHLLFGGNHVAGKVHNIFDIGLHSTYGDFSKVIRLLDNEQICGTIPRVEKGPWMNELKEKKIRVNDLSEENPLKIEILLGADTLGELFTGRLIPLSNGLTAIETRLGWTLMGQKTVKESTTALNVISLHLTSATVEELWKLETIGICDPSESKSRAEQELAAKTHFKKTVTQNEEGRYTVSLPWIEGRREIPNNRVIAEKRLESTTRKLQSIGHFQNYQEIFKAWEEEGIISQCSMEEEVNKNYHYIPHRAVLKPESKTTPIRPVFDASCKSGRAPSLNDCLEKGPNLLELIPSILMRFRIGKIGVISDIRKAFLMIDVKEEDRNFLRFLWWEDYSKKKMKILQHNRVVFGMNCSPFLLGAVIEFHLEKVEEQFKDVAMKLLKSLYVDNCVTSVDDYGQYEHFKTISTNLMAQAKMELRQWECTKDHSKENITSVLGLKWDKDDDSLFCVSLDGELPQKLTKRIILSSVQKVFDPLGFLSPAVLKPKLLLQKSWSDKNTWDEELPEEMRSDFQKWYTEISSVMNQIKVPRNCTGHNQLDGNYQLHTFSDASKLAYAALTFLRVETEDGVSVQMLQCKSRVAPLKVVTIPRLELLGCSIAARLTKSIQEALNMSEIPTYFWSDSTTALAWIQRNDDWGTFVGNRVREICSLSDPQQWRHVPGLLNPADLPSRGCNPSYLLESRWWEGPDWLKKNSSEWPSGKGEIDEELVRAEVKKTVIMTNQVIEEPLAWTDKHSSYSKILRIAAMVFRARDKFMKKSSEHTKNPTQEEIDQAELQMVKIIQENSFPKNQSVISGLRVNLDERGIYHVKTKLTFRDDAPGFKFPLLLPTSHPLVDKMIRDDHYCNGHPGVQFMMASLREKYWIVHSRRVIKKIVQSCVICRKWSEKRREVPPAPLPEDRVTTGRIFDVTGVDLAGPLTLKDGSKCWIVMFTCAQYRAVHLELVKSLDTDSFLAAWTRFVCRKRRPKTVYSDNGTNFVGSVNLFKNIDWNKVREKTGQERVQWRFNPPAAPWWGGWWERLIRSVKDLLKRELGTASLSYVELETCLCKVEQLMNNRPLCFVTNDPDDLQTLTPSMFFNYMAGTECPESQLLTVKGLQHKFKNMEVLFDELRSRFRQEYLAQMAQRGKVMNPEEFKVGDMVWVGADNKKRIEWPMARILELFPGRDGKVRVAKVRTRNGELVRPLQRLYPMGISAYDQFISISSAPSNPPDPILKKKKKEKVVLEIPTEEPTKKTTKSGRQVKTPQRFRN